MIYIAMGANLPSRYGSPEKTLRKAELVLQANNIQIIKSSRIWVTPPVPVSDQPHYRNSVLQVKTDLGAEPLLKLLHSIESEFGRVRYEKNEARVLDLDLLAYGDSVLKTRSLMLPHPRMHERGFVLVPMHEIAPEWRHPVLRKTAFELMSALDLAGHTVLSQEKAA